MTKQKRFKKVIKWMESKGAEWESSFREEKIKGFWNITLFDWCLALSLTIGIPLMVLPMRLFNCKKEVYWEEIK